LVGVLVVLLHSCGAVPWESSRFSAGKMSMWMVRWELYPTGGRRNNVASSDPEKTYVLPSASQKKRSSATCSVVTGMRCAFAWPT